MKITEEEEKHEDSKKRERQRRPLSGNQAAKLKHNQLGLSTKHDTQYPNKAEFLQKFKFAKEYLDLGDILLGMNKQEVSENNKHEFLLIDVFDFGSQDDEEKLDNFYNRLIAQCARYQK